MCSEKKLVSSTFDKSECWKINFKKQWRTDGKGAEGADRPGRAAIRRGGKNWGDNGKNCGDMGASGISRLLGRVSE